MCPGTTELGCHRKHVGARALRIMRQSLNPGEALTRFLPLWGSDLRQLDDAIRIAHSSDQQQLMRAQPISLPARPGRAYTRMLPMLDCVTVATPRLSCLNRKIFRTPMARSI